MKRISIKEEGLKRTNRLSLMLNNREARALGIYCNRYRVRNKSEFLRVTIMRAIIKRFEEEHPTLWEETEPSLFAKKSANHNITKYSLPSPRLSGAGIPPQGGPSVKNPASGGI